LPFRTPERIATVAKLKADIFGVKTGDIYPVTISEGAECPPELLEAALEVGAVEEKAGRAALESYRAALAKKAAHAAEADGAGA
jgi:hypothetical protein